MKIGLGHRDTSKGTSKVGKSFTVFGRVLDIILDPSHPMYQEKDGSQGLYGVFYEELGKSVSSLDLSSIPFAYNSNINLQVLPLKGEIVEIKLEPSEHRIDNATAVKAYWTKIIPLWNSPLHNAYPDLAKESKPDFGYNFKETSVIPLQRFPGDVVLEGRGGSSLRMGTTIHTLNLLTDESNNGKPFTILRTGEITDTSDTYVEDINKDQASIYLLSDHKIPVEPVQAFKTSWKTLPAPVNSYKGNQVVVSSGRLVFMSSKENILILSKKSVGVAGTSLNLEGVDYVNLDAPKIYIGGVSSRTEQEPVMLGGVTVEWLESLFTKFERLVKNLAEMDPDPEIGIPVLMAEAAAIQKTLPSLKNQLKTLTSSKTFVE